MNFTSIYIQLRKHSFEYSKLPTSEFSVCILADFDILVLFCKKSGPVSDKGAPPPCSDAFGEVSFELHEMHIQFHLS